MNELSKLMKKMGIQRKYIFLLLLRSPFDALRAWMLANLMKAVFLCLEACDGGRLWVVCITYGLICALLFFYNGTVWSLYAAFSAKVEAGLQRILLRRLMSLPLKQVDGRFGAEWITRLNSDVQAVNMMMSGPLNLPHAVVSVINTMLSSFLMLGSSRLLFVVAWVFIIPHLFLNYGVVLKYAPKWKKKAQRAVAESTAAIKPLVTEAESILLYDAGELMMEKYQESSRRLMKLNLGMQMRNALSSAVLRLFGCGGFFAMLAVGYTLVLKGRMPLAEVMYCLQVRLSILTGMFMLFNSMNNIKANSVCAERVNNVLEKEGDYEG